MYEFIGKVSTPLPKALQFNFWLVSQFSSPPRSSKATISFSFLLRKHPYPFIGRQILFLLFYLIYLIASNLQDDSHAPSFIRYRLMQPCRPSFNRIEGGILYKAYEPLHLSERILTPIINPQFYIIFSFNMQIDCILYLAAPSSIMPLP